MEKQNLIKPSGSVRVGDEYIRIKPTGNFESVTEIGNLLLRGKEFGDLIYLKDVAEIKRAYRTPPTNLNRFNGKNALVLGISIASGGNVVKMGDAIKERLKELEIQTPAGLNIEIITYQSDLVTESIDNFIEILMGA